MQELVKKQRYSRGTSLPYANGGIPRVRRGGERSDKVRTVQVKNGIVFSQSGKKTRLAEYLKGNIESVQD